MSSDPTGGITFKFQDKLPKLPIPPIEDTTKRYLEAVKPLQVSQTVYFWKGKKNFSRGSGSWVHGVHDKPRALVVYVFQRISPYG